MGNTAKGLLGLAEIAGAVIADVATAGAAIPMTMPLITMGAGMVAGSIAGMLSQPPDRANRPKDLGANLTDPTTSLPVVYGKARLGISRVFVQTAQYQTTNNYHLWVIGALCHGPVNGIDEIYLDGNLAFDQQGVITSTPDKPGTNYLGSVGVWKAFGTDGQKTIEPRSALSTVTGTAIDGKKTLRLTFGANHNFVNGDVVYLTGVSNMPDGDYAITGIPSATQIEIDTGPDFVAVGGGAGGTVDYFTPDLTGIFPGQWTPKHNGAGIAYVVMRMDFDPTKFPNGVPKIECVVRGKPLHDPRTPVTLQIQQVYQTAGVGPYLSTTSIKTTAAHGLSAGQIIFISGCYNPSMNGYQRVGTVLSSTDITCYVEYGADIGSPAGTIDALSTQTGSNPSILNPNSNPALAVRDYLLDTRYGISTPVAEINDPAFAGEASYCDQLVNTPWVDRGDLSAASFFIWNTVPDPANPTNSTVITFQEQINGQLTVGDIVQIVGAAAPSLSDIAIVTSVSFSSITVNIKTDSAEGTQGVIKVICPASRIYNYSNIVSTAPVAGNAGSNLGHTAVTVSSSYGFQVGQTVFVQGTLVGSNSYALKGSQGIVAIVGNVLTLGGSTKGTDTSGTGRIIGCTPEGQQSASNIILGTSSTGTWTQITLSQPIGTYIVGSTVLISGANAPAMDGIWPIVGLTATGSPVIKIPFDSTALGSQSQGGTAQQMVAAAQYQVNGALDSSRPVKDNMEQILASMRGALVYQGGQYRTWTRRVVTPTGFVLDESNIIGDWDIVTPSARDMANIVRVLIGQNRKKNYQTDFAEWPDPNNLAYVNQFYLDDNQVYLRKEFELPLCNDFWQGQTIAQVLRRESRTGVVVGVTCTEAALQLTYGDVIGLTHDTPGWVNQLFWVGDIAIGADATVRLTLLFYDPSAYVLENFSDAPLPGETKLANPFFCSPPSNLTISNVPGYNALAVSWTASPDADVDHYEIQWKATSSPTWLQHNNTTRDITSVNLPIPDLTVPYDVQVRAVNAYAVPSVWVQVLGQTAAGGSGSTPIVCPAINVTVEAENPLGWQGMVASVVWVNPTSVFFAYMGCTVQATGNTASNVNMGNASPFRLAVAPDTPYSLTPFTVSTTGVKTLGTAITFRTPPSNTYSATFGLYGGAGGGSEIKAVHGSYSVTTGGTSAGSPPGWSGTNPNTVVTPGNPSGVWRSAPAGAVIDLVSNVVAISGQYTLTYSLSGTTGFGGNVRMMIEYAINGGSYQIYGYTPTQACPYSATGQTIVVTLSATILAGATSVAFRLSAQAEDTSHVANSTTTGIATGSSIAWNYISSGSTLVRRGIQVNDEANQPHITLTPNATPPVAANAVAGELTMAALNSGSLNVLQYHDGNGIVTVQRTEQYILSTSPTTTISASYAGVNGTLIAVTAGETWEFIITGTTGSASAGTPGVFVSLIPSGGAAFSIADWQATYTTGSTTPVTNAAQSGNPPAQGTSLNVLAIFTQKWYVVVSTSGNAQIGLKAETSGDAVTIFRGTSIVGRRLA